MHITQMPGGTELPFNADGDGLSLTVPTFTCHCALAIETHEVASPRCVTMFLG